MSSLCATERSPIVDQLTSLPGFDSLSHGPKVALHPVHTHRNAVDERERLRVLRQNLAERAGTVFPDSGLVVIRFSRNRFPAGLNLRVTAAVKTIPIFCRLTTLVVLDARAYKPPAVVPDCSCLPGQVFRPNQLRSQRSIIATLFQV